MPALQLFGRRWLLSSDDVALPASICAMFHLVWCCLLIAWLASVHGPRECSGAWEYDVAVGGLLGSFALSFVVEVGVVRHSLQGGPFETARRRQVPRLLYADFASHVCQVAFNAYCTHLVYRAQQPVCPEEGKVWSPRNAMLALVWCTWSLIALLLCLLVLSYNMFPNYREGASWEKRCNCLALLLCCSRGHKGQYRDLAGKQQRLSSRLGSLFAMMLSHIDMTPTDVLLAFSLAMMLQRIQRRRQREQQQQQGGASKGGGAAGSTAAAGGAGVERTQGSQTLGWGRAAAADMQAGSSGLGSIQMSPQGSPQPAGSVGSFDELLAGHSLNGLLDIEAGLGSSRRSSSGGGRGLPRRTASQRPLLSSLPGPTSSRNGGGHGERSGDGSGGGGGGYGYVRQETGSSSGLERMDSFVPAHPGSPPGEGGEELQVGAEKTGEGPGGEPLPAESDAGEEGPPDVDTLQEAAWACKYAFASYGMLLYIWSRPGTGCLQLCCGRNCGLLLGTTAGRKARKKLDLRLMHNLNREATQQAAGLADHDLLDVRYEGEKPHVLPYIIAVDEPRKALVLAIRGSLSLDDVVRDLLFEPASLDEWVQSGRRWEDPPPELAPATSATRYAGHAGILEAARATFMDLQEHGVLHDVLLAPGGRCHGYRLVVTGHSLGAGCAYLLSLYVRHFCPNLRCWAFSPPGGLASAALCSESASWCTSIACGKEWIPRLSVRTFSRMRDEMVFAALRCRQPKWWVLLTLIQGRQWREEELFYTPDQLPQEAREALRSYHDSVRHSTAVREFMELAGDFTPPGRVFHLRPTGKTTGGRWGRPKQRQYRAVRLDGEELIDQGILLSSRMMADHMPDYLLATLRSMVRALRHQHSTATISDKAGQRLTDQLFEHEPFAQEGDDGEQTQNGAGSAADRDGSSSSRSAAGGGGAGEGSSRRNEGGINCAAPAAAVLAPPAAVQQQSPLHTGVAYTPQPPVQQVLPERQSAVSARSPSSV